MNQDDKEARRKEKALLACGYEDWWQCRFCKRWDSPDQLRIYEAKSAGYPYRRAEHLGCNAEYARKHRANHRDAYRERDRLQGPDRLNKEGPVRRYNPSDKKPKPRNRSYINAGKPLLPNT